MAYQSLYRRYRPQRFAEVRGQDHLVRALRNAVSEERVGHAYLLSGPRGTGKTTTARILAKALNCPDLVDGEPCGVCDSCVNIETGRSFDLQELDAASNRGIGEMKALLETIALGTPGRRKVYILDEVHMLTKEASAALLKTLEEPPGHVVFVLATTDPQKVLPTIRSRTQHFELNLLPADDLRSLVDDIAADAGLDLSEDQIEYAIRKGGGSARDTLSALDQVAAAGSAPDAGDPLEQLIDALVDGDAGAALAGVQHALAAGREPRVLGERLLEELRDAFLVTMGVELPHCSEASRERARSVGERWGARSIARALEVLGEALVDMRQAADPRIPLEVALLRIGRPESDDSLAAVIQRLERLEKAVSGAAPLAATADAVPSAVPSGPADDASSAPAACAPAAPTTGAATAAATRPGDAAPDDAAASDTGTSEPVRAAGKPGGRPADSAREVLAARQTRAAASPPPEPAAPPEPVPAVVDPPDASAPPGGSRPALGAHRGNRSTRPGAATPKESVVAEVSAGVDDAMTEDRPAAEGRSPSEGASEGAPSGDLPTRDELTLAWGDVVRPKLAQRTRSRWTGRFLEVSGGAAVFGLANTITCDRCEEGRTEVEGLLADHFGRPVAVRLVVDDHSVPPPDSFDGLAPQSSATDDDPAEDMDAIGPVHELEDAGDASEGVARLTDAFPGVELVAIDEQP